MLIGKMAGVPTRPSLADFKLVSKFKGCFSESCEQISEFTKWIISELAIHF